MHTVFTLLLGLALWSLLWMGPLCAILWVGYRLVSLRLRRQEYTRFFLNLVETSLQQGRRPEEIIISISDSRDASMGVYFHLLAFHLKVGVPLGEALDKVPQLVSPRIAAIFRAGLKIGALDKVQPACRQLAKDAFSQTYGALNYLMLVAFIGFPVNVIILSFLQIYVLPRFASIGEGMGISMPATVVLLMHFKGLIFVFQILMVAFVWCIGLVYVDGPWVFPSFKNALAPIAQPLAYALPWRRKRLQRDFSAMLAILMDAGMPEADALALAVETTGNSIFQKRAQRALAGLGDGMTLPEAIRMIDDTGEFHWRLTNAMHAQGGFFKAIAGWNESLDAKAFQQEQGTAHVVTTGLVVLNGALVGFIVVTLFSVLISIINAGVLW